MLKTIFYTLDMLHNFYNYNQILTLLTQIERKKVPVGTDRLVHFLKS